MMKMKTSAVDEVPVAEERGSMKGSLAVNVWTTKTQAAAMAMPASIRISAE